LLKTHLQEMMNTMIITTTTMTTATSLMINTNTHDHFCDQLLREVN
jgi:hypothetical protein